MAVDSYICPTCGWEVQVGGECAGCAPRKVTRRRKVAAAAKKPWEQDEMYDGLDLPDGEFDYEDFSSREMSKAPHRRIGIKLYHWVTAVVLIALLVLMIAGGVFG